MLHRILVSVVDDDESVRESLPDLLDEFGFAGRTFASAEAFLASDIVDLTHCLILDVALPGVSGPRLKRELNRRGLDIPTIFITGQNDDGIRARVLRQGAIDCLFKPFSADELRAALRAAMPDARWP